MKKHIQVTLDFEIEIDDAPVSDNPERQESMDAQWHLFQAIIVNREFLRTYLSWEVMSFLEGMNGQDWLEIIMGGTSAESEDVLAPMITKLSEEDQRYFNEAREAGLFTESVEELLECFTKQLLRSDVTETV